MTEQQLADYTPRTASGAALKERLEAATQEETQPDDDGERYSADTGHDRNV
jgi:hypothetical protein